MDNGHPGLNGDPAQKRVMLVDDIEKDHAEILLQRLEDEYV